MLNIHKGCEPSLLSEYRKQEDADWDGPALPNGTTFSDVKQAIRRTLYKEQRGLCAYCMQELPDPDAPDNTEAIINSSKTKIEHFFPRELSEGPFAYRRSDYRNMLLCCDGGAHHHSGALTCDSAKGNRVLSHVPNPASGDDVEAQLTYSHDGRLSAPQEWMEEISTVLNLNDDNLCLARKVTRSRFLKVCKERYKIRSLTPEKARYLLEKFCHRRIGYIGIILDLLRRRAADSEH